VRACAGIFYLGYAVFQIPSNLIITKVGAPLWLGILIFCWGVVAACTSTMKTAGQYYAVRFLLGMAPAACHHHRPHICQ
jgi:MFS family permease